MNGCWSAEGDIMEREPVVVLSSSAVPETRGLVSSHAVGGELFKIFIVNVALTILTLGIYRFWAKTRLRRYLWGSVEIMGDRLEYTGTGKELFIGFLVVFFLILLPLFGGIGALDMALTGEYEEARAVLAGAQGLVIVFLIGVAFYRARRYRLTRTHWRGIYGAQSGSALKYGLMAITTYFASLLTLGLAWPVCSVWLKRYEMAHTWIGDEQPEFTPTVKKLYLPFLVVWVFGMVYAAVAVAVFVGGDMPTSPEDGKKFIGLVVIIYLGLIPLGLSFTWYRGKAYSHFVSSTRFHQQSLSSSISGFGYMWLIFSNGLLVLFTLGLAMPWTLKRYLNFVERHVGLVGDGDFSTLRQSTQEKPSHGEGLADAFDVGGI